MRTRVALLGTLALVLPGCDLEGALTPAPTAHCSEAGSLCHLEGGALGVCEQLSCKGGETPPCFKCVSQH